MVKIGIEIESPQTGERLIFRSTADSSYGQLFQAELIVKPGPYVVGSHVHPSQEESFVVLAGSYGYKIGNRTGVAHPGDTLVCPVGVPHSQWNAGDDVMRIYYEHRPALTSAEIFFETQFGLSRDGKLSPKGDINLLQGAVLLQEVGDFIRPASPPIAVQNAVFPV
ncbi:MAG: cupin domain-containing protein, partial [Candidatus Dormibacteraeota bacterium]|nr:cupin domain-containing protein [Candidatus Dormibacteraeota bacterium]